MSLEVEGEVEFGECSLDLRLEAGWTWNCLSVSQLVLACVQILSFEDSECCDNFIVAVRNFLDSMSLTIKTTSMTEAEIKGGSVNRDERQAVLDEFFRLACLQVRVRLH